MTPTPSHTRRLGFAVLLAILLGVPSVHAQDELKNQTYHFGTHPARTSVTFVSEADIETIHGVSNAMEGSIRVDAKGTSATGTLHIPVSSMKTGIDLRDEHLRSADWLDAKKHPKVTLRIVTAEQGAKDPKTWTYTADLTIKGVTKRITGNVKVDPIPDRFSAALGGGSWVRVRAAFAVKLSDHGIEIPQQIGAKVNDTWQIGIDVYGTTKAPKPSTGK